MARLAEGVVLDGRYRLESPLSPDEQVWHARDEHLGRPVVVRALLRRPDPAAVAAWSAIRSPHVVGVTDLGPSVPEPDDGAAVSGWLVEDFADAPTLREVVSRLGPLGARDTEGILTDVLAGLAVVHGAGLTHGAVDPDTVQVGASGARVVLGPAVHSPPHATDDGRRTDLAATLRLGAWCLTGHDPPPSATTGDLLEQLEEAMPRAACLSTLGLLRRQQDQEPAPAMAPDPEEAVAAAGAPPDRPPAPEPAAGPEPAAEPQPVRTEPAAARVEVRRERTARPLPALGTLTAAARSVPPGLLVAALAIAALAFLSGRPDAFTKVPALTGQHIDAAQGSAAESGFLLEASTVEHGGPPGVVVSQDPDPGRLERRGQTIRLQVAAGIQQVPVPDVRGLPVEEAIRVLHAGNLRAGQDVRYDVDADAQPGRVAATSPAAGRFVDAGSPVQIIAAPPASDSPEEQPE